MSIMSDLYNLHCATGCFH